MTPHIDGEHHTDIPVLRDFYYLIIDGAPVLELPPVEDITDTLP